MLRVFNDTARYADQGGNRRPGAFAIYLEPWHADIFDFLDCRKNTGKEEQRARYDHVECISLIISKSAKCFKVLIQYFSQET